MIKPSITFRDIADRPDADPVVVLAVCLAVVLSCFSPRVLGVLLGLVIFFSLVRPC